MRVVYHESDGSRLSFDGQEVVLHVCRYDGHVESRPVPKAELNRLLQLRQERLASLYISDFWRRVRAARGQDRDDSPPEWFYE